MVSFQDDAGVFEALDDPGMNMEEVEGTGKTPLIMAAMSGNAEMTKTLMEAGASTEATDWFFNTPLIIAAERGKTEVCQKFFLTRKMHSQ